MDRPPQRDVTATVPLALVLLSVLVLPPPATLTPSIKPAVATPAVPLSVVPSSTPSTPRYRSNAGAADVRDLADAVLSAGDNEGLPFVIIDKLNAHAYAIDANGRLLGDAAVLLGSARGDESVPGIGERPIAQIRPFERTTPAGRFVALAGTNASGEDVVWVDFAAAISMHRVRVIDPREHRLQRLASPSAADKRISYGCINLPPAFFDGVISPLFSGGARAVYILPELKPASEVFRFDRIGSGRV